MLFRPFPHQPTKQIQHSPGLSEDWFQFYQQYLIANLVKSYKRPCFVCYHSLKMELPKTKQLLLGGLAESGVLQSRFSVGALADEGIKQASGNLHTNHGCVSFINFFISQIFTKAVYQSLGINSQLTSISHPSIFHQTYQMHTSIKISFLFSLQC